MLCRQRAHLSSTPQNRFPNFFLVLVVFSIWFVGVMCWTPFIYCECCQHVMTWLVWFLRRRCRAGDLNCNALLTMKLVRRVKCQHSTKGTLNSCLCDSHTSKMVTKTKFLCCSSWLRLVTVWPEADSLLRKWLTHFDWLSNVLHFQFPQLLWVLGGMSLFRNASSVFAPLVQLTQFECHPKRAKLIYRERNALGPILFLVVVLLQEVCQLTTTVI